MQQRATETPEETLQRAMRDPEVASIMQDPVLQKVGVFSVFGHGTFLTRELLCPLSDPARRTIEPGLLDGPHPKPTDHGQDSKAGASRYPPPRALVKGAFVHGESAYTVDTFSFCSMWMQW